MELDLNLVFDFTNFYLFFSQRLLFPALRQILYSHRGEASRSAVERMSRAVVANSAYVCMYESGRADRLLHAAAVGQRQLDRHFPVPAVCGASSAG